MRSDILRILKRNVTLRNSVVFVAFMSLILNIYTLNRLHNHSTVQTSLLMPKEVPVYGNKEQLIEEFNIVSQSEYDGRMFEMKQSADKYKIEFEGIFKWEEEFEKILTILPVLHYPSNNTDSSNSTIFRILYKKGIRWDKLKPPGEVLDKIPRKLTMDKISDGFVSNRNREEKGGVVSKGVGGNKIWDCKEMAEIERSRDYPKIKYTSRSASQSRGRLELSVNDTISIIQKRFINEGKGSVFVGGDKGENGEFELAKREVFNLIASNGWYGMPTLYGLCITNRKYDDITYKHWDQDVPEDKPYLMRYIISHFDESNALPFCFADSSVEECVKLRKIFYRIRSRERPAVAALTVMFNIAKLFQNLFENRAYMDGIPSHEILMTPDFGVHINDVSSLIILPRDNNNLMADYSRLLSGTICKSGLDCPSPTWYKSNFGNSVGASCSEILGRCSSVGLCYGVDVQSYVCVFARWVFGPLRDLVPHSWEHKFDLIRLLAHAAEPTPEKRCTWDILKSGFQSLLQNASLTWPDD